jgi:hypothetical protein
MLPPIALSLGTPFFGIITIPISIYRGGNGDDSFVGVATFDKSGTGATSILQAVIWVSPKRQLSNATLAPSCSYYASCAATRGGCARILGYQTPVMTYRIPRHIGCSPHRSKDLGDEPVYVRSCGAGEGSLLLLLPTPVRSLYTQVTALKAYKVHEVDQGVAWASLVVPDGGGVLAAEQEEGDREMVLWRS